MKKLLFHCFSLICFISVLRVSGQHKIAAILNESYVWNNIDIFAYNRFIVYINGRYVFRALCALKTNLGICKLSYIGYLKKAKNILVVLVHRFEHNGQMMAHEPGLTVLIELKGTVM